MLDLPEPFASLPREQLLYSHASSIEPLLRLSSELYDSKNSDEFTKHWIKRDDSNSGLACGGNKMRKLEYVLPEALNHGATVLVTTGGLQSYHMRQVAAAGAKFGLKTHLIPNDVVKSSDAEYKKLGNIQLTHLTSAEHAPYDSQLEDIMKLCTSNGGIPYWIPSGASDHPLGGAGYARCAFEISQQEQELGVHFDTIVVACAGGSTLGGLIAGFKLLAETTAGSEESRKQRQIIGVDALAHAAGESEADVLRIAKGTAAKIGLSESCIQKEDVHVDLRWNAGAYGFVDDQTQAAMKPMASLEGIIVDPGYTGKTLNGMIQKARLGEFDGDENVLFIHTGGVQALSAYPNIR